MKCETFLKLRPDSETEPYIYTLEFSEQEVREIVKNQKKDFVDQINREIFEVLTEEYNKYNKEN